MIIKNETTMKKKIALILSVSVILFTSGLIFSFSSGRKQNHFSATRANSYPPDVAIAWIKMQQRLFVGTPGLLPHVTARAYAYVGLTLYESIVPGLPGYQSIAPQLSGKLILPSIQQGKQFHCEASANAALASILRNLLPHASPILLKSVDSLEADFYKRFQSDGNAETLQSSADFGRKVAAAIFEWSKTDGGHEAFKNPISESYILPNGTGKWVPTDTIFKSPVYPYWGSNRTFIPGVAEATQPPPPPAYSETPGSDFYNAVNELYVMSKNLKQKDSLIARFWAYEPLNDDDEPVFDDVSHAANMATQMILLKKLSLQDAAVLYCKHAIAGNDAAISCVKTKFHYNLVRPVTYIRTVLKHPNWNTVIFTPPFPEYTSGHAVVSMSYATILDDAFGEIPFTDHSFDNSYGPRKFESFEAYAKEVGLSRLYGGIHYRFAMNEGLKQGRKVGKMVSQLKFKK